MYVVGVNCCLCVLLNEMGSFEFWSFYIDIDIIRVYVVGADGHVSSCMRGLFFSAYCVGLTVPVLICYSLSVSF
jgi:hypothetical protein